MILFPLSEETFDKTGPDGISIFYVSCIVSQIVYSAGGSRFKGGVGSEMVRFFADPIVPTNYRRSKWCHSFTKWRI